MSQNLSSAAVVNGALRVNQCPADPRYMFLNSVVPDKLASSEAS